MSVTPHEILASAGAHLEGGGEMNSRNAISRAYYAAFHMALSVFPQGAVRGGEGAGVHKAYLDHLQEAEPGSTMRLVGVALNAMKGKRTRADYYLGENIRPFEASIQISKAKEVFSQLENHQTAGIPPSADPVPATQVSPTLSSPAKLPADRRSVLTRLK